jgi:hypothetical protein
MKSIRPLFFGLMMVAMVAGSVWVNLQGGPNGGGEAWLIPVGMVGALYAVAVVADVIFHAWKGIGQACRVCGHVRPSKSFRFAGPCPQCGE